MIIIKFLFEFKGRITRVQFQVYLLFSIFFVITFTTFLDLIFEYIPELTLVVAIISTIFLVLYWWSVLAVCIKRLHDLGYTGWMMLIGLIPYLGALILLFSLALLRGESIDNMYGINPYRTNIK